MKADRAKTRRILWRWGNTLEYCASKQREIEGFQAMAESMRDLCAAPLTGMPKGKGKTADATGDAVIRLETLAVEYEQVVDDILEDIQSALRLKTTIDEWVEQLPHEKQKILELRYKGGFNWNYVALKTCFEQRHVKRLESETVDWLSSKIQT